MHVYTRITDLILTIKLLNKTGLISKVQLMTVLQKKKCTTQNYTSQLQTLTDKQRNLKGHEET